MMFDNMLMFLKDAAFGDASAEIDLDGANVGRGEPLKIYIGSGADFVGNITVTLETADTEGGAYDASGAMDLTAAQVKEGAYMYFPFPTKRWAKLTHAGASAGTNINSGVVLDVQSGM